jgi:hypothetical protein
MIEIIFILVNRFYCFFIIVNGLLCQILGCVILGFGLLGIGDRSINRLLGRIGLIIVAFVS